MAAVGERRPSKAPRGAGLTAALRESFDRAATAGGGDRTHRIEIAGTVLALRFAGDGLERLLLPAFGHLPAPAGAAEVEVLIWDGQSSGERPAWPWRDVHRGPHGEVEFEDEPGLSAVHYPYNGVQVLDWDARTLFFFAPSPEAVPWYELGAPAAHGPALAPVGRSREGAAARRLGWRRSGPGC